MADTKPQHSPLPWSISIDDNGDRVIVSEEVMIVAARPNLQDAAFIVRAVNAIDACVEQLQTMATAFHANGRHGGPFSACDSSVCEDNRDALKLAREGK